MRRLLPLSPMEFLLDENVSAKTLNRLRRANFLVKSVKTENILGVKNGNLITIGKQHNWILITHDQDFLAPHITDYYAIIVVKIHPAIDAISGAILENFLQSTDENAIIGRIIILEKFSWRYKT